jgi:hypothetical protein
VSLDLGWPLTDRMQLRVRAQDLNPSLVECLVDDLRLVAPANDGSLTVLASGALGSNIRLGMTAAPAALCFPLVALGRTAGTTYPGVGGTLFLDPNTTAVLPALVAAASGYGALDVTVPANPVLVGLPLSFQAATVQGSAVAFGGNAVDVTLQ